MASDAIREGVFAINKPCGSSSAHILRECQKHFNPSALFKPTIESTTAKRLQESGGQWRRRRDAKKAAQVKIGHGGTLDPLATGILIVGIGSATKQLLQFLDCTKSYETTVVFGASTDTYDRVGRILTRRPYDHITREMVQEALASFRGKQKQMPPLYSALKMNGKPLYEYAREGKPIPRNIEARDVEALQVELVEWYEPGTHSHRWPTEEAEAAERNLAEQVWRVKKQQETSKKLTAEEKEEDDQAIAAHESFKRRFEQRQDELITDRPQKRRRQGKEALMSGALGSLPQPHHSSKGSNLVPTTADTSTPPPWTDEGPPACKIRLTVTSGYYVRNFCHDLGAKLESAAIMAELCRVRQRDFTVGGINTLDFADLARGEDVWGPKVAGMLARWNGQPKKGTPAPRDGPTSPGRPASREGRDQRQAEPPRARNSSSPPIEGQRPLSAPQDETAPPPPRKAQAAAGDEQAMNPVPAASDGPGMKTSSAASGDARETKPSSTTSDARKTKPSPASGDAQETIPSSASGDARKTKPSAAAGDAREAKSSPAAGDARESKSSPASSPSRGRCEDEKSWNGIDD